MKTRTRKIQRLKKKKDTFPRNRFAVQQQIRFRSARKTMTLKHARFRHARNRLAQRCGNHCLDADHNISSKSRTCKHAKFEKNTNALQRAGLLRTHASYVLCEISNTKRSQFRVRLTLQQISYYIDSCTRRKILISMRLLNIACKSTVPIRSKTRRAGFMKFETETTAKNTNSFCEG